VIDKDLNLGEKHQSDSTGKISSVETAGMSVSAKLHSLFAQCSYS